MYISAPVLSSNSPKLLNNKIDRYEGMIYNGNIGDSFTFTSARNRRYEKASKKEFQIKKNNGGFMDIEKQENLDNCIKKHNLQEQVDKYTNEFLKIYNKKNNSFLKKGENIEYTFGEFSVVAAVPIVDINNCHNFIYNLEFNKNTGECTDDWVTQAHINR